MNFSTSVGTNKVLFSGAIVLQPQQTYWTIHIEDLSFTFDFVERGEDAPKVEAAPQTGKSVKIQLVDWHNPLGISYSLTKVANVRGQNIDINFFVQTIGERNSANRLVNYSVVES